MKRKMIFVANYSDGREMAIDAYRVESYTRYTCDGEGVEVTMHSGARLILSNDLDQDLYEGHDLVTLLDLILFGGDNEIID